MKKFTIYYFLFLLFFFSFFSSGVMDSQDGLQYLAVARNIYYNGEPTAPPYEYDARKNIHLSTYVGRDGKTYSPTGLGYSLALVPSVAITDVVYNFYDLAPPEHFPLQSGWLILMVASFTNAFFGAFLGITLYKYMRLLKIEHKDAFLLSFLGIVSTNLFVYTKHSFAHMMFIAFLVFSFYILRLYPQKKLDKYLIISGVSFGIAIITYNQTFLLTIPSYILYLLLLTSPKLNTQSLRKLLKRLYLIFVGVLPFLLIYIWFENTRARPSSNLANPTFIIDYIKIKASNFPFTVFFEGLWGQIFSPGRSLFIYSPVLLTPLIFWHKFKKNNRVEIATFVSLSLIYVIFYASQYSVGVPGQGITGLWAGESSWGPRYLTPTIPFGVLLVGYIYKNFSKTLELVLFYSLVALGLYIQALGVLMPYQIKFHELEQDFYINQTQYTSYQYSNLLPRYSPIIMMTKKLGKLVQRFPKTINHGPYNVRFYDGVDLPFNVGPERWRAIEDVGYISFDNHKNDVEVVSFDLINHPITENSSSSARLNFALNGKELLSQHASLDAAERKTIDITIPANLVENTHNNLSIDIDYEKDEVLKNNSQILGLISFYINGKVINKESIDVPYVSQLGSTITGVEYRNWGQLNKDPWRFWELHTQVYERTPDFWWIKPLYYWDMPKILYLFALANAAGIIFFGYQAYKIKVF